MHGGGENMHKKSRERKERKQAVFTEQLRVVPFILQVSKHKCLPLV